MNLRASDCTIAKLSEFACQHQVRTRATQSTWYIAITEVPWLTCSFCIYFKLIEICVKPRLSGGTTERSDVECNCDVRSPRLQHTQRFLRFGHIFIRSDCIWSYHVFIMNLDIYVINLRASDGPTAISTELTILQQVRVRSTNSTKYIVIIEVTWHNCSFYVYFKLTEQCIKLRLSDGSTERSDVEHNCDVCSPRLQDTQRFIGFRHI